MNQKGISTVVLLGAFILVAALVAVMFMGDLQFPSIDTRLWSLRHIFCGGTGVPPPITDFFNWVGYNLCTTGLPVLAGIVFAIIFVAWVLSIFPQLSAFPPAWVVAGLVGFIVGFIVSAFVLDWWWALLIVGATIAAVKLKVMK